MLACITALRSALYTDTVLAARTALLAETTARAKVNLGGGNSLRNYHAETGFSRPQQNGVPPTYL